MALLHKDFEKRERILRLLTTKSINQKTLPISKVAKNNEATEKSNYKIINWKEYNESLCRRGDLTIWIEEDLSDKWDYEGISQQGRPFIYSDDCIEFLLNLKVIFRLPYRQTRGFAGSILGLMDLDLLLPSYTQISRRFANIEVDIRVKEPGVLKEHDRNKILLEIGEYEDYEEGRKRWKENSNYHRRSLSETAMFRFKKIFGSELYSRKIETQEVEAQIKISVLNRMTALGMPISISIN